MTCPNETHVHFHIDGLADLAAQLTRMEQMMTTGAEQIQGLVAKSQQIGDLARDILSDFRAFRDAMLAERENLTAAGQSAMDAANADLDARLGELGVLDVEVGDADGSDTPAPEPAPGE